MHGLTNPKTVLQLSKGSNALFVLYVTVAACVTSIKASICCIPAEL